MTHRHTFDRPPTTAQLEDGDFRRRCECSHRPATRRLTFPYIPPGSNKLHNMHPQAIGKLRRQIRNDTALLLMGTPREPFERSRITLAFQWRTRQRRDPLNYVEATKALVDQLVDWWIVDDDAAHLEAVVRGTVGTGKADHIVVTLEELGQETTS